MRKLVIILLLVFASLTASADKWYIATTGSNTHGKGTLADPWLTLKHAADTVTGANFVGDTVMVGVGTFTETARIDLAVGVSIYGAGITSIIKSTYAPTDVTDAAIRLNSATANPVDGNQSISYIKLDGDNLTGTKAIVINFRKNVKVHHCTIVDFIDSGVSFHCHYHPTNWDEPSIYDYSTGNEIHDCVIQNCSGHMTSPAAGLIRAESTEGMLIYNNILDQSQRAVGSNSDIMCGYWNKGLQLYNNTWTKLDSEGADWNFFFEIHYGQGGMDIYGNTFNGAATLDISGVIKGDYTYGARVHDNDFIAGISVLNDGGTSVAIDLESFDEENDIYIYNNYFKNVRFGIFINNIFTSADNINIYYNIFENIGNATNNWSFGVFLMSLWDVTDVPTPFSNINIFNNTIDCGTKGFSGIGAAVWGTITNLNIRNNIISGNFESYAVDFFLGGGAEAATVNTLNINKNIFNGTGDDSFHHVAEIIITNENTAGNITSNPLFVNPIDFHLRVGSPAIDAGYKTEIIEDYDGNVVPFDGITDIGAYEFGSHKGGGVTVTTLGKDGNANLLVDKNGRIIIIQ